MFQLGEDLAFAAKAIESGAGKNRTARDELDGDCFVESFVGAGCLIDGTHATATNFTHDRISAKAAASEVCGCDLSPEPAVLLEESGGAFVSKQERPELLVENWRFELQVAEKIGTVDRWQFEGLLKQGTKICFGGRVHKKLRLLLSYSWWIWKNGPSLGKLHNY